MIRLIDDHVLKNFNHMNIYLYNLFKPYVWKGKKEHVYV